MTGDMTGVTLHLPSHASSTIKQRAGEEEGGRSLGGTKSKRRTRDGFGSFQSLKDAQEEEDGDQKGDEGEVPSTHGSRLRLTPTGELSLKRLGEAQGQGEGQGQGAESYAPQSLTVERSSDSRSIAQRKGETISS